MYRRDTSDDHLTDETLATGGPVSAAAGGHLAACPRCRSRRAGWQNVAVAVGQFSDDLVGEFSTPSFDAVIRPALTGPADVEVDVARPGLGPSWRLTAALAAAQLRLLPTALAPLTVLGFVGCVLLGVLAEDTALSVGLFGLAVTLVIQLGTLTACAARTDPRMELLATTTVTPPMVYALRLAVVLALDTALAVGASVVATRLGVASSVPDLVSGWLGQAMLASAVGVVGAVWRSTSVGAAAGATVWLLGVLVTVPDGGVSARIGALVAPLWTTAPSTLLLASLLLAAAVPGMRRPRHRPTSA